MAADDRRGVVTLEAKNGGCVDLEHARTLLRHRREYALRTCLGGDERRNAPECALLLREAADLSELRFRVAFERTVVCGRRALTQVDARRDEQRRASSVLARHEPVRPGDQLALSVLRHPVTDLRAGQPGAPDVSEHLAECLRFFGRNDEVASVAADHLVTVEAGNPLAGLVEEQNSSVLVEYADERHRRLCKDFGELVPEDEVRRLRHRRDSPRSRPARAWSFQPFPL